MPSKPRVLVFIVAYQAETTIEKVLTRIPASLNEEYDVEVLIIDDASADATFEKARQSRLQGNLPFPLTVLKNPVNQMYGGNQKIGFHYAVEKGFDMVAMVHGDGQYAPEALPALLKPLATGEADAVMGSRMATWLGALKGGMPLYKYVGNRILTFYQNTVLGAKLTEYHSGYRLYSTRALRSIPFQLNTDNFHFDTEIIIQLLLAGLKIVEIPIPTFYGEEICRVNGMRYAWDVVKATTAARLQKYCLLYRRNFDVNPDSSSNWAHKPKLSFCSSQTLALAEVKDNSKVVHFGCEAEDLVEPLYEKGCLVSQLDHAINTPSDLEDCDHILLLDMIEHLHNPERFMDALREASAANRRTNVIVSTANVGFFITRFMLLLGQFNYGRKGILDLRHTRLFTSDSLCRLLQESGFEVISKRGVPAPFPLVVSHKGLADCLLRLNQWLITVSTSLFAYQIMVIAKPRPTLSVLLDDAYFHSSGLEQKADALVRTQ